MADEALDCLANSVQYPLETPSKRCLHEGILRGLSKQFCDSTR